MTETTPRAASLLLTAAAAAAAGAAFHRAFGPAELVVPIGVAALAPVALVAATTWRRGSPLAANALGSLGLLAGLLAALFVASGTAPGQAPAAVLDAAVDGWAELLDVTLPTPSEPRLLAVPVMLTWLAAAAGAEIVSRTRTVLAPAVPSVLAFGAGLALTVPGSGSNLPVAAVLVAVVGLLALSRRVETTASDVREAAGGRVTARVLPVVAAATAVGVLVGPLLPFLDSDPFDPRDGRPLPQRETEVANPLGYLSAWQRVPDKVLFTVRLATDGSPNDSSPSDGSPTDGSPTDSTPNLRLAVLDQYDGRTWSSSARFTPAGLHVPAGSAESVGSELATADPVTQDVEIADLDLPLLPAVDRPLELSGSDIAVDVDEGTLVCTAQIHPGLRYHVVSVPRVVADPTDLAVAHNATGPEADAHRRVPAGTPPVVREAARTATAAAVTPFQQAYLLTTYLRENFTYDPQAPSGHTLGHLRFFLETGRRGTSEQFATTFAVAGRTIGLATRVVVGFAPPGATGQGQVRAGDAFAWPEVAFEGLGWVPFYPTPGPSSAGPSNVPGESSAAAATMLEAASAPQPTPDTPRRKPVRRLPASIKTEKPSWLLTAALVAVGVLVVAALAYLGTAVVRPAVRRRRRRRAVDDRDRLVGAWHDALDTLDGYGVVVRAAATPNETVDVTAAATTTTTGSAKAAKAAGVAGVAGATGAAVNGAADDPMRRLAALTSVALFAPEPVRRSAADEAWQQQTRLRRALRRDVPRRRRLRGRLAPRRVLGRRPRPGAGPHPRT